MMTIERLQKAVLNEAEAEAKRIVDEATAESERTLAEADERRRSELEFATEQAKTQAARETARELGRARQEGRLEILRAKNEVLNSVFDRARERFRGMSGDDYRGLLGNWLRKLAPDAGGALHVNPREKERFPPGFLDWVNEGREGGSRFTSVTEDPKVPDGCVVEGEDFKIDLTIEKRLTDLRASLAAELSRELFKS